MRVIVAGWLEFAGQDCAAIIRGGAAHIAASRREQGCIAYDWAVDPLEDATVRVYEEWESEADLGRHFLDPSYAAMRDHLDVCPAVRCFSFHVFDHDREGRRALMRNVIDALERRAIRPAISARLKLADVREAHRLLEAGSALGKIVMTP